MNPRRALLVVGAGCVFVRPLAAQVANPAALQAAISAFSDGRPVRDGRVMLVIDALVENGNTVPVSVSVDSPMTAADHVQRIALFTESNPQPEVAVFHFSPASGRAQVSTRMRMATSQHVIALAQFSDGSVWQQRLAVVVTLAACLDGG